jgi:hypothetical protein
MMPVEPLSRRIGHAADAVLLDTAALDLRVAIMACCRAERHAELLGRLGLLLADAVAAARTPEPAIAAIPGGISDSI